MSTFNHVVIENGWSALAVCDLYAFSAAIGGVSLRGESLGVVQAYFPWLFPCHLVFANVYGDRPLLTLPYLLSVSKDLVGLGLGRGCPTS